MTDLHAQRLAGKVAVVTGAGSGIGQATALRLANEGARVLGVDVVDDLADRLTGLDPTPGELVAHTADLSDEAANQAAIDAARDTFGSIDIVCPMAGILRTAHSHELTTQTWDQVLAINLSAPFWLVRAALPELIERQGAVVFCSSTAAEFGHPWMAAYAASKGAIGSLVRTLAVEYASTGLRVNAVAPGSVATGLTRGFSMPDGADADLVRRIMAPNGPGQPADVAGVVAMLASSDGTHCNGITIRIDGGTHV